MVTRNYVRFLTIAVEVFSVFSPDNSSNGAAELARIYRGQKSPLFVKYRGLQRLYGFVRRNRPALTITSIKSLHFCSSSLSHVFKAEWVMLRDKCWKLHMKLLYRLNEHPLVLFLFIPYGFGRMNTLGVINLGKLCHSSIIIIVLPILEFSYAYAAYSKVMLHGIQR